MKKGTLAQLLWLALGLYCSLVAALANPELDLTDPAGYWWMHNAAETTVNSKIAEGYRIIRVSVRDVSPLRFTAAFVGNSGAYQRTGAGWNFGLTEAQVNGIAGDATRRIVDISSYVDGSQVRYTVVWVGNTGTQAASGSIIVGAASLQALQNQVSATGKRVIDIEAVTVPGSTTTYSAVLVEKEPGNDRCQIIGEGTIEDINDRVFKSESDTSGTEPCSGFQHRVIALDPVGNDRFVYVAESRKNNEKPWWFADLKYHGINGAAASSSDYIPDPTSLEQIDNLGVLSDRLQGRVFDVKHYSVSGSDRYVALVTDNNQFPQRGPSAGTDATLQAIDKAMQNFLKKWGIPGGTIAVTTGARLAYAQGYGFSHVSRGVDRQPRPVTPETLFRIASCSKPLTSLAIQKLIEQGLLTLDTTPFGQIFTQEPKDPNLKKLTIRQILEHKSWFPDSLGWAAAVDTWTSADAPAVYANRVDGSWLYQNSNYHLLTLVIEALTHMSYEEYFKQNFLTPLGIQRMRISHERQEGFVTDTPLIEAAGYSDITKHNRRNEDGTFNDPETSDWILTPSSRVGASTWAVSPVDALRLMVSADGSLSGPRVLSASSFDRIVTGARQGNGEATDAPANANTNMYVLGFDNTDLGNGRRALQHNGYVATTNAQIVLRNDGIKFLISFNGDVATGYSILSAHGKRIQAYAPIWDVLNALQNIFNTMTLPAQDHWPDFGFSPAPGVDCTGVPAWVAGTSYAPGTKAQVAGSLYRCKPFPFSGWCGQVGYKPGVDASWRDAWELVDVCNAGLVGAGRPTNDCAVLPDWQVGTYAGGEVVKHAGQVYQCKGWPQSGWCGQVGYEPGVTLYWPNAWVLLSACA
ncbi:hypothetical protein GP486_007446 [Trichoglossum hirsutum]|uniref:Chitin-binding type-3 domain-containing protein n=1 Tax=Trichoglossum hirsutum TaxID=265104 RepID=A0A9P8L6V2_9PEZI|nr:hypothetical protein GP486_007446 [Trichoglossum hirsutum]